MLPSPVFHPLTADLIPAFEAVMGPSGACFGCWCTYFRVPPKLREALGPEGRKALMLARIHDGPPPGLVMWLGDQPTGWLQIGPRADIPQWNNPRRSSTPLPDATAADPSVWAVSCFFLRGPHRGVGLSHALLGAGIAHARTQGARLLEASPMDDAKQSKSIGLFVGSTRVFEAAGFVAVARHKPNRPLMRLDLGTAEAP